MLTPQQSLLRSTKYCYAAGVCIHDVSSSIGENSSGLNMSVTLIPDHSTSSINAKICSRNQSTTGTEVFTVCKMSYC